MQGAVFLFFFEEKLSIEIKIIFYQSIHLSIPK
jgi:hypothetical protein